MAKVSVPLEKCKAVGGPSKCRYHSKVIKLNVAASKVGEFANNPAELSKALDTYFKARSAVEEEEKGGWKEIYAVTVENPLDVADINEIFLGTYREVSYNSETGLSTSGIKEFGTYGDSPNSYWSPSELLDAISLSEDGLSRSKNGLTVTYRGKPVTLKLAYFEGSFDEYYNESGRPRSIVLEANGNQFFRGTYFYDENSDNPIYEESWEPVIKTPKGWETVNGYQKLSTDLILAKKGMKGTYISAGLSEPLDATFIGRKNYIDPNDPSIRQVAEFQDNKDGSTFKAYQDNVGNWFDYDENMEYKTRILFKFPIAKS